jgi:hypothetical protein
MHCLLNQEVIGDDGTGQVISIPIEVKNGTKIFKWYQGYQLLDFTI